MAPHPKQLLTTLISHVSHSGVYIITFHSDMLLSSFSVAVYNTMSKATYIRRVYLGLWFQRVSAV